MAAAAAAGAALAGESGEWESWDGKWLCSRRAGDREGWGNGRVLGELEIRNGGIGCVQGAVANWEGCGDWPWPGRAGDRE